MRVLVYDPAHTGHHGEYLAHLLRHLSEQARTVTATFLVHPEFTQRYASLVERVCENSRIQFVEKLIRSSSQKLSAGRIAARSFREWKIVVEEATRRQVDHCLLMELNPLQLALAVPRSRAVPFQVHGILFHPYPRLSPQGSTPLERLVHAVTRTRKRWILQRIARNPSVQSIFILNDYDTVRSLNNEVYGDEPFVYLCDPVPLPPTGSAAAVSSPREGMDADQSRMVVITPGSIRRNKGVLKALDAFQHLNEELCRRIVYRVSGRVTDGVRTHLDERLERLRRERPELEVQVRDQFFTEEKFHYELAKAKVILLPYQRTEGSSGIFGRAARQGIPVVGPSEGLMGELIEAYDLGLTTDTSSPHALAEALARAVREANVLSGTPGMKRYVRERSPRNFARAILRRLCESND